MRMMRKWNTCKNMSAWFGKGSGGGKKKKALPFLSQFPPILLSYLGFLHFVDPTISEPGLIG